MESQADTDEAIQTRARSAERAAKEMALAQDNKEAALTKDREVLFKLLNSMERSSNEPFPDIESIKDALKELNSKQGAYNEAHEEALTYSKDPSKLIQRLHHLEESCATIRNKVITLTQGAIPKASKAPSIAASDQSRASQASSITRATMAALQQQAVEERERQEKEDEIRRLKLEAEIEKREMRRRAEEQEIEMRRRAEEHEREMKRQMEEQERP